MRFWDANAIVPLIVNEQRSADMRALLNSDGDQVVRWGTRPECVSARAQGQRASHQPHGRGTGPRRAVPPEHELERGAAERQTTGTGRKFPGCLPPEGCRRASTGRCLRVVRRADTGPGVRMPRSSTRQRCGFRRLRASALIVDHIRDRNLVPLGRRPTCTGRYLYVGAQDVVLTIMHLTVR